MRRFERSLRGSIRRRRKDTENFWKGRFLFMRWWRMHRSVRRLPTTSAQELTFAQQVYGYGRKNDVLLGISTSGNAKNVTLAAEVAKAKGMKVISLTGKTGGSLKEIGDTAVCVPEKETYLIQELHLPVYHALCRMIEAHFLGERQIYEKHFRV